MCFGYSKEPSHRDGSLEYSHHMFWMRNKKNNFSYAPLSGGLKLILPRSGYAVFDQVCLFDRGINEHD